MGTSEPYPCVVLKVSPPCVPGHRAVLAFQFIGGGGSGGTLTSFRCVGGGRGKLTDQGRNNSFSFLMKNR